VAPGALISDFRAESLAVAIRHGTAPMRHRGARIWSRALLAPSMHIESARRRERSGATMPSPTESDRRTPLRTTSNDTGTAETDENYDLVSVLYHSLKAADACTQYIADAEDAADDELVDFFEGARQQHNRLAAEARQLLAQRLSDSVAAGEDEE
jgi:hypothetical protein